MDDKQAMILSSADEYKLKAVNDVLQSKLVKRGVSLKSLTYGEIEPAAGSSVRQKVELQQGIPIEKAREIVKVVKNSKLKVQASIQGDFVRVSSKDRDTLQQSSHLSSNPISVSTCSLRITDLTDRAGWLEYRP